jgi:hypothetical protein
VSPQPAPHRPPSRGVADPGRAGARKAAAKARGAKAGPKPDSVWERAEMELLAAELDAALPPAGK